MHYENQVGDEPTPTEYVDSLIEVTRECIRVLKPSGSLWVNLGDSYAGKPPGPQGQTGQRATRASANEPHKANRGERVRRERAEQFTREDAAWLAGVIDSDGSIGIHVNQQAEGRAPSFVPWVRIGQMRPEVVQRAAEVCGTGRVMHDGRGVWNWSASAQQARWVLERIHPWLLIKRRQAWAAVEVARHVEERNAKGSWQPLTADDVAYRQRLREAVMTWNQGELDDCPVPEPRPVSLPIYPYAPKAKSLHDLPHAYAQACVGRLGLIKRAEVCWSKPNGLPESVTDRVRRSHEVWFHFVLQPRYYSAVDEIREPHADPEDAMRPRAGKRADMPRVAGLGAAGNQPGNPLGKLPGSVWTIPTEPLTVPDHLGVDHFAAYPTEFPRRIIQGWSPRGVCTVCNEGRRPVTDVAYRTIYSPSTDLRGVALGDRRGNGQPYGNAERLSTITGYACACTPWHMEPTPTDRDPDNEVLVYDWHLWDPPPTTPGVVLDVFGGTGTTALVARALGRDAVTIDMSADYCRLASWRTQDRDQLAKVLGVAKVEAPHPDEVPLFDMDVPQPKVRANAGSSLVGVPRQTCEACGYRSQNARADACEKCGAARLDILGGDVA